MCNGVLSISEEQLPAILYIELDEGVVAGTGPVVANDLIGSSAPLITAAL